MTAAHVPVGGTYPFALTTIANDTGYDGMVFARDLTFRSAWCPDEAPPDGVAHVGYLPATRMVALSSVARLVDHLARGTEVGGGLARRVLRAMSDVLHPRGAGVVIETAQGSVTTAFGGLIRDDPETRSEFLQLVRGLRGDTVRR